jgi:hypothetical protein
MMRISLHALYSVMLSTLICGVGFVVGNAAILIAGDISGLDSAIEVMLGMAELPIAVVIWTLMALTCFGGPILLGLIGYGFVCDRILKRWFWPLCLMISLCVAALSLLFAKMVFGQYWAQLGTQDGGSIVQGEFLTVAIAVAVSAGAFWNFNRLQRLELVQGPR